MNKKINVLVFPAGSEIGLEIHKSLKYNLHIELFGASGKPDHAKFVYDQDHYFEGDFYVDQSHFIELFNNLLEKLKIDVIFPTHDTIALFLAKHRDKVRAKILTSSFEAAEVARRKTLTYEFFKDFGFCTKVFGAPFQEVTFPVFLKPDSGQGAKGTSVAYNRSELLFKVGENPDLVVCEYLPGAELSVDCFSNRKNELLFIGPRVRNRVEMGISFNSSTVPLTSEVEYIARTLNDSLKLTGAWFFQVKSDKNGKLKLMEFAVRQASTMGLYRQAGVNFALLSVFDAMDIDVRILTNSYPIELDRCLHNVYKISMGYDRVYIDFDDTIIINGNVNLVALQYLYQCRNYKIEVNLLTKHIFDLDESLDRFCISKSLFDTIILLRPDQEKVDFINPVNAIFIDNYFFDREKVSKALGIPVFDVDAIESLLR